MVRRPTGEKVPKAEGAFMGMGGIPALLSALGCLEEWQGLVGLGVGLPVWGRGPARVGLRWGTDFLFGERLGAAPYAAGDPSPGLLNEGPQPA